MVKQPDLVARRLYRSLLRACKPFTGPSKHAVSLNCLLHRTGSEEYDSYKALRDDEVTAARPALENGELKRIRLERAKDLTISYEDIQLDSRDGTALHIDRTPDPIHLRLFRYFLREVVSGSQQGIRKMIFPSDVDSARLHRLIKREFRDYDPGCISAVFDRSTRRKVGFVALREINKKLHYYRQLEESAPELPLDQAALHVSPLPRTRPEQYLQPGTFLLAHPYMHDSFFARSVVCILDHNSQEGDTLDGLPSGHTYGLIVNRVAVVDTSGRNRSLRQAVDVDRLPEKFVQVFGDMVVREGGPVHPSLQLVYSLTPEQDATLNIEGRRMQMALNGGYTECHSDDEFVENRDNILTHRATYFGGDVSEILDAVVSGKMSRDSVSLFVGSSCWSPGQLEQEVEAGFWLPCRGPMEIARTGECEYTYVGRKGDFLAGTTGSSSTSRPPLPDLWLSMMSACGHAEAKLARLVYHQETTENAAACDSFE